MVTLIHDHNCVLMTVVRKVNPEVGPGQCPTQAPLSLRRLRTTAVQSLYNTNKNISIYLKESTGVRDIS